MSAAAKSSRRQSTVSTTGSHAPILGSAQSQRAGPRGHGKPRQVSTDTPKILIDGKDLTPRALSVDGITVESATKPKAMMMGSTPGVSVPEALLAETSGMSVTSGVSAQGSFISSGLHTPRSTGEMSDAEPELEIAPKGMGAEEDPTMVDYAVWANKLRNATLVPHEPSKDILSDRDLDQQVYITLVESDTINLLDKPSVSVAGLDENGEPTEEGLRVAADNERYAALLASKAGSDNFAEASSQTRRRMQKTKDVQVSSSVVSSVGINTTTWTIADAQGPGGLVDEEDVNASEIGGAQAEAVSTSSKHHGTQANLTAILGGKGVVTRNVRDAIKVSLDDLGHAVRIMERNLNQNNFFEKLLMYRAIGTASVGEQDTVEFLWRYEEQSITSGRNVSCMAFNKQQNSLLAVGYGPFNFSEAKSSGMVLFWSIKNPQYPDRRIDTASGVTTVAFSSDTPNLIAIGLYNGSILVYNLKDDAVPMKPLAETRLETGKHADPVWRIQWIPQESGAENLVSVSSDGRVSRWHLKKGLEHTDIMKLKRVQQPKARQGSSTSKAQNDKAFINRAGSGMCVDFSTRDPANYLVGTEDGAVHKCSVSYQEQYLDSYFGHRGPVYHCSWSPYLPNIFLSCSADWTVKVWDETSEHAIMSLNSGTEAVADAQWSPYISTVYGCCMTDGRLEVWDLQQSTLRPVAKFEMTGRKLSCMLFNPVDPVIVVGDDQGAVSVFRLHGFGNGSEATTEQSRILQELIDSARVQA